MALLTSSTLIEAIEQNKEGSRRSGCFGFSKSGRRNSRNKDCQFWQQENHPVQLTTTLFTLDKLNYIHNGNYIAKGEMI
jgi:putative transposase